LNTAVPEPVVSPPFVSQARIQSVAVTWVSWLASRTPALTQGWLVPNSGSPLSSAARASCVPMLSSGTDRVRHWGMPGWMTGMSATGRPFHARESRWLVGVSGTPFPPMLSTIW
jgi:hypothetical protein